MKKGGIEPFFAAINVVLEKGSSDLKNFELYREKKTTILHTGTVFFFQEKKKKCQFSVEDVFFLLSTRFLR